MKLCFITISLLYLEKWNSNPTSFTAGAFQLPSKPHLSFTSEKKDVQINKKYYCLQRRNQFGLITPPTPSIFLLYQSSSSSSSSPNENETKKKSQTRSRNKSKKQQQQEQKQTQSKDNIKNKTNDKASVDLFDLSSSQNIKSDKNFYQVDDSQSNYYETLSDNNAGFYDDDDIDDIYDDEDADLDDDDYDVSNADVDPQYAAKVFSQYDDNYDELSDTGEPLYSRDTDLIETEREDRLFLSTDEKCILVAIEDTSKLRKAEQMRQKNVMNIDRDRNYVFHEDYYPSNENVFEEDIYFSLEESMTEMRELIKTAGLRLTGEVIQRVNEPFPRTYVGTGKLEEVKECMNRHGACTVVFDAELTPRQQKTLENTFNRELIQNDFLGSASADVKVLDRTALILDIFAQHAKTREGKLQVDLALHQYRKPRLTKMWTHLERQSGAGGVGLRGPGESQLEIDKRLIRDRIIVLQRKIDNVQKQRDLHRRGREKSGLPILAVVGYTNAGKSTLLNHLTRAGVMAEDILFATLDPTTRKVKLPGYKTHPEVMITDTVGFIQALPTQLIAAFRATLEEVIEADVLIHVIDASDPTWRKHEQSVLQTLDEIDAGHKPMVRVFNKIDLMPRLEADALRYETAGMEEMSVAVSALTGDGMEDFVAVVEDALSELLVSIEVEIPFSKGEELNIIHEVGAVETIDYRDTGTYVACKVPESLANRLKPYYVNELGSSASSNTSSDEEEIDWVALGRGRHKKNDN